MYRYGLCLLARPEFFDKYIKKGGEMRRKGSLGRIVGGFLLLVVALGATEVNIAPDAVTRATQGYNEYEGELAFLTDGLYPGSDDTAEAFVWPNKGNLVFQFDEPRQVAGLRIYVGEDAGAYQAVAYLGARFGKDGQTDAALAVVAADTVDFEFQENTWVDLPFPAGTETDYIELSTESGAIFYEIEILASAAEPTQVETRTWGEIKRQQW